MSQLEITLNSSARRTSRIGDKKNEHFQFVLRFASSNNYYSARPKPRLKHFRLSAKDEQNAVHMDRFFEFVIK